MLEQVKSHRHGESAIAADLNRGRVLDALTDLYQRRPRRLPILIGRPLYHHAYKTLRNFLGNGGGFLSNNASRNASVSSNSNNKIKSRRARTVAVDGTAARAFVMRIRD